MKRFLIAAALIASAGVASAADVGVSVSISQPGVYGRVDIGRVPQPPVLIYPQPVLIAQPPVVVNRAPIYLHVPPGHAKNWRKHCGSYNACGQPVYFVQEDWYQRHYVHAAPRPQPRREVRHDRDRDDHRSHGDRDHGHGKGHDKGRGHDHGRGGRDH